MADLWLIYGANGYTGNLIAERAKSRGLSPILAGRGEAVKRLAERLSLPYRIFDLSNPQATREGLADVSAVLHCAGPFSRTSRPMADACLEKKVHYLDITGEISVFEELHARSEAAKKAQVTLLPGVGFDVVPSDCLAATLKSRMPEATHLELAFAAQGSLSRGTIKTMIEHWEHGGAIRKNGKIISVRTAHVSKTVAFSDKKRRITALPWGDVATAFYSTEIPNVTVYVAGPAIMPAVTALMSVMKPVLKNQKLKSFLQHVVEKRISGPSAKMNQEGSVKMWGRVTDATGSFLEAWLDAPETYSLTADTAIEATKRVARGEVATGYLTPSQAFGQDFILQFPGTKLTFAS